MVKRRRLDSTDIDRLKTIAIDQDLNYQSLIGSVLHRYVAGTLIDIVEAMYIQNIKTKGVVSDSFLKLPFLCFHLMAETRCFLLPILFII